MITWFSDLDNTLVYSHRTNFEEEVVLVEKIDGKEQSYMTRNSYDFMCNMDINLVPVTTRTIEQYKRLFVFNEGIYVKHALVCNGAILLVDGCVDEDWLQETSSFAHNGIQDLCNIKKDFHNYEIKSVEDIFFYFKSSNPQEEAVIYRKRYERSNVFIGFDKRKIYFLPKEVNKGDAVERYINKYRVDTAIASGDSEFDISMLRVADIAMGPDLLLREIESNVKKYPLGEKKVIANAICENMLNIIKENGNEFK